ncbi:hydroxymethylglutaryl-CoA lyase [uncultured Imperialibacter sp.]|uniref:hydroxymethylglutaryl-CoA lyase n=1 Tax=uncultured Imperialibacter sp. TaxID=1672639 RepID=UPI0030DD5112|tara:strand:- start:46842 stop:47687 length:846 start_codon:yes stop_codon:yes gene_type:complete
MKIIECPRDAMQGWKSFIPTQSKVDYINQLLKVGFDTIDFGSFVSPKAIPQMRDTAEVLSQLDLSNSPTKLLAIVANLRGADEACQHPEIHYLGFPLSLSETFQQKNTNKSISEALDTVQETQNLCSKYDKVLVVYLSMGFGNPYGDPYEPSLVAEFVNKLDAMGIEIISLSDTIGVSSPANIKALFQEVIPAFPHIEFGAHLHSTKESAWEKIVAVYQAGCRRMDGAINGYGGCPMAEDDLVGNIATEIVVDYLITHNHKLIYNSSELSKSLLMCQKVFS